MSSLILGIVVASLSSLPDYDWKIYSWSNKQIIRLRKSLLKYLIFPYYISLIIINRVFRHRTTTHSIFFAGAFFLLGYLILPVFYLIGLSILLHIIEDCFTVSGVPVFYPISKKSIKIPIINTRKHLKEQKIGSYLAIICLIILLLFF